MFESFLAVPLHFTVEFLGFLVAAGAALLAATRPSLVPGPRSNRISVALGFVVLGVAQVIHGGSFTAEAFDGADLVVAARTLGYALILIGVVGTLRPASVAAIGGYSLEQPLVLAPAGAALLVAVAALSSSSKGNRSYRPLALAMVLFAISELLTGAAPEAVFGVGTVDGFAYAAHVAKMFGYLGVTAWFWGAIVSSIRIRFVASFAALLVAVVLTLSTALTGVISSNVESEELDRVASQATGAVESINDSVEAELTRSVRLLADFPGIQIRMESDDPGSTARVIREGGIVTSNFVIVDPARDLPAIAGEGPAIVKRRRDDPKFPPLTEGQELALLGSPVFTAVAGDETSISAGPVRINDDSENTTRLAVMAAARVFNDARYVGTIALGRWIDDLYLQRIVAQLGPDTAASVISGEEVVASTLRGPRKRELALPEDVKAQLLLSGSSSAQLDLGDASYFTGFSLIEKSGTQVGILAISSKATVVASTRSEVNRLLFIAAMLVGAIATALAWFSGRRITRPIQELTETASQVREGDLQAQAPVYGDDEVGQLGETFNEMTASLLKMTSDLRTAAREEHSLRSRIETIIQSMADGLVAVDADRNILAFNREAEHLTGVPAEEAVGKPVSEVLVARDAQGVSIQLPIHTLSEGSLGGVQLESRDRESIPVAVTVAVLRSEDDAVSGAVAVLRDMTREREVERMKTEFLSNISHELRTPLTPIKGYAEILQRKEVPREKMQQFVRGILDSTGRLERIVELLVDFSAMEAGRMAPKSVHVDMAAMLNDLAEKWKERAPHHEMITELESNLPDVIGDERLLRRSLEELLDNAVKFSPRGGTIRLEARGASNGNAAPGMVEVSIADEGIGITPDDLPKIFSDFQQLDGSETRTYGGLGLGLAYVRRIAQAHDGDVRVESAPDEGTKLTIALPAAERNGA